MRNWVNYRRRRGCGKVGNSKSFPRPHGGWLFHNHCRLRHQCEQRQMVAFDESLGTDRDTAYVYDGEGRRIQMVVGADSNNQICLLGYGNQIDCVQYREHTCPKIRSSVPQFELDRFLVEVTPVAGPYIPQAETTERLQLVRPGTCINNGDHLSSRSSNLCASGPEWGMKSTPSNRAT